MGIVTVVVVEGGLWQPGVLSFGPQVVEASRRVKSAIFGIVTPAS